MGVLGLVGGAEVGWGYWGQLGVLGLIGGVGVGWGYWGRLVVLGWVVGVGGAEVGWGCCSPPPGHREHHKASKQKGILLPLGFIQQLDPFGCLGMGGGGKIGKSCRGEAELFAFAPPRGRRRCGMDGAERNGGIQRAPLCCLASSWRP